MDEKMFLEKMIAFFPDLSKEKDEHVIQFGSLLITVFIEDNIMPRVINLIKKEREIDKLVALFDFFEYVCENATEKCLNIFTITTLEILGNDRKILETARKYMGPTTIRMQREADVAIGRKMERYW